MLLQHGRRKSEEITSCPRVQARANRLDLGGNVVGRPCRRSAQQQVRREGCQPFLARRIVTGAAQHRERNAHQRQPVVFHDHNLEAIRERGFVERRKLHRPKLGWGRWTCRKLRRQRDNVQQANR